MNAKLDETFRIIRREIKDMQGARGESIFLRKKRVSGYIIGLFRRFNEYAEGGDPIETDHYHYL